jgi:hypothetical protein
MKQLAISHPPPNEYDPYYGRYTSLVAGDDILTTLKDQLAETTALLSALDPGEGEMRYLPGKWSVKEVWGHVCDSERIFAYRALRISRRDQTPIEGFEQDDYVRGGPFAQVQLADLVEEFGYIRRATLALFGCLDEAAWLRRGLANRSEISVRAIAYIIAGHELHHRTILQQRYFTES